jgi:hypothetical protein
MFTSLKVVRMALVDCDCTRRSATRARRRDIGTRCSGRSATMASALTTLGCGRAGRAARVGAGDTAAGAAAGPGGTADVFLEDAAAATGALHVGGGMPFSAMILRAAGMAVAAAAPERRPGAAAALAAAWRGGCAGLGLGIDLGDDFAGGDGLAVLLDDLDDHAGIGAGSSSTTLSVSMSIRFWSRATASPSLTCQADSVASATDSDSWGTLTSMIMISPLFLDAEGSVHDFLLLLGVFRGIADGRRRR